MQLPSYWYTVQFNSHEFASLCLAAVITKIKSRLHSWFILWLYILHGHAYIYTRRSHTMPEIPLLDYIMFWVNAIPVETSKACVTPGRESETKKSAENNPQCPFSWHHNISNCDVTTVFKMVAILNTYVTPFAAYHVWCCIILCMAWLAVLKIHRR